MRGKWRGKGSFLREKWECGKLSSTIPHHNLATVHLEIMSPFFFSFFLNIKSVLAKEKQK